MSLNIRKVGVEQIQEVRDIGIKSYLPHYTHLWKPDGIEWYMERCFGDKSLRKDFSDPNIEYYIVENDGENIGIVKLVLKKALPDFDIENALYLEKIYFVKEWTGKGVGRKLIEFVLHRAEELRRDYVWLMAMDTSAKPIEAYEKAGFTVDSYTNLGDEFELMKEEFRGMVVMRNCLRQNGN
jgi:GNAT superfamily N-acetyltransferase